VVGVLGWVCGVVWGGCVWGGGEIREEEGEENKREKIYK